VQLDSILVEDLVEYVREDKEGVDGEGSSNRAAGSDFGNVELAEAPKGQKAVNKQSDAKPTKKTAAKAAPNFSDMDDDIPF
jgi:single-stranded DNA-binding protein